MKVLHITPWYPNAENPLEALWIKRVIASIDEVEQEIWHVSVVPGKKLSLKHGSDKQVKKRILIIIPTKRWFIIEFTNFIVLAWLLWFRIDRNVKIINFHIAYPQLTYWSILKRKISVPIIISEHWSAYHFNFGLPVSKKLERIKSIFHHSIPIVTVSEALRQDISNFVGMPLEESYVIPNVVPMKFVEDSSWERKGNHSLLMASQWNWPKNPFVVLRAFSEFVKQHQYQLKIIGYGNQLHEMKELVTSMGIQDSVQFLGKLTEDHVANEMRSADMFLHGSLYETFSVVCAEALYYGTPVIASDVGGIKELVNESNGILVNENTVNCWLEAMEVSTGRAFDYKAIAEDAAKRFSAQRVGKMYKEVYERVIEAKKF